MRLSSFRAERQLVEILENDLFFTIPEIERLYLQLFDTVLTKENLEILNHKMDGWVTGLILFYHYIKSKSVDEIDGFLRDLKGSHMIISSYLEEDIYDNQCPGLFCGGFCICDHTGNNSRSI